MSASSSPTLSPSSASATARLVAVVDLPTPPLPEAIATIALTFGSGRYEFYLSVGRCIGSRALVRPEVKQTIFENRAADTAAKLVLL